MGALRLERDSIYKLFQEADPQSQEASFLHGRYGAYREIIEGLEVFGVCDKQ